LSRRLTDGRIGDLRFN